MPIRFACPSCRTRYALNDRSAGRVIDCRACGRPVQVPDVPEATPVAGGAAPEAGTDAPEALAVPEPIPPPAAVVVYRPPRRVREYDRGPPPRRRARRRPGFRCPYCGTRETPEVESKVSLAGWLVFLFLLAFICIPLCWVGLLMKEEHAVCSECGIRLD